MSDSDLHAAFRALRERHDGHCPDEKATLHRALFATQRRARRRRVTRWALIPIAAVLAASSAWAGATGRLGPVVHAVAEKLRIDGRDATRGAPPPATHDVGARGEPAAPAPLEVAAPPSPMETAAPPCAASGIAEPPAVDAPTPSPSAPTSHPAPAPARSAAEPEPTALPRTKAPQPAPHADAVPSADNIPPEPTNTALAARSSAPVDPGSELFAEAHRLHFVVKDPARALEAWDTYLRASPRGRFVPEARYNRALALVRLGRVADARPELEAFATGAYGEYRRDEARALLEELRRDSP